VFKKGRHSVEPGHLRGGKDARSGIDATSRIGSLDRESTQRTRTEHVAQGPAFG